MANVLKIKRSDTSPAAAPTALARGELAYQEVSNILYVGSGNETGGEAANRPVVAGPLNFMPVPTADVSLNSKKITSLATPTASTDAATKAYVDAVKTGLDVKESVKLATTAGISGFPDLSSAPDIDGVAVQDGDRVLIKDQSSASENGIWTWSDSGTIFFRATDFDASTEVTAGAFTFVEEGTANADSGWVVTTNDAITVGTTAIAWAQFSGAGQITAGDGLQKTGNTLSADLKTNGGLEFDSGELRIDLSDSGIAASGNLPGSAVTPSGQGWVPAAGSSGQFLAYNNAWATPPNTTYTADDGISLSGTAFSVAAGTGLTQDSSGLSLDLQGVAETAVDEEDDYFIFLDGGATGAAKKEKLADFVSAIAGGNLSENSGRLSVDTAAVADAEAKLASGDQIHTFVTGLGYVTATSTNVFTNTTIDCGTF